jgi:hypothetical protein
VRVFAKITPVIRHKSRCTCASVGIASSSSTKSAEQNSSRESKTLKDLQLFTLVLEFSCLFTRLRCRLYLEPHESSPHSRILFIHDRVHILTSTLRSSKQPYLSRVCNPKSLSNYLISHGCNLASVAADLSYNA